jgi:hypothetical protein
VSPPSAPDAENHDTSEDSAGDVVIEAAPDTDDHERGHGASVESDPAVGDIPPV